MTSTASADTLLRASCCKPASHLGLFGCDCSEGSKREREWIGESETLQVASSVRTTTTRSIMSISWKSLAVPGMLTHTAFLAFSSQLLFRYLDPRPLTSNQSIIFNTLVVAMLASYARLVLTSPGFVPVSWTPQSGGDEQSDNHDTVRRWCRKCQTSKPPRAHHCKICQRCVLKMDHHCPWTMNCISHCTFPHYIRFLFYAVAAMVYLESFLYTRLAAMWDKRKLPYYLGPSVIQILHVILLTLANSFTLFTLSILLIRSIWSLSVNTTTIEGWEIDRHKALLRRARVQGGYLNGPRGTKVRLVKQEFPYDIGIWSNLAQGMGSRNIVAWFWPFSVSPSAETAFAFQENGFEDANTPWPPPDPDRVIVKENYPNEQLQAKFQSGHGIPGLDKPNTVSTQHVIPPHSQSLHSDHMRQRTPREASQRRDEIHQCPSFEGRRFEQDGIPWKNWEGETLDDFGVDEGAELYDEDDLPDFFMMPKSR